MCMIQMKEKNFIPPFLYDTHFRVWRHLIFIIVLAIITFNQVFITFKDSQPVLGSHIYLICFLLWIAYLAAMYFNYFYLAPRLLLKGKYTIYSIVLCLIAFAFPMLFVCEEYWLRNAFGLPHRITSYTNPLILVDNLSTTVITAVCFCSMSVIMLFREWIKGNEEVSRLEKERIRSELNKLKGQIAPAFLSRTLRHASSLAESKPQQSSDMLMQLGQLLRYQLYDCNRERILLKSEINSLNKFFELEQSNSPGIRYQIHIKGDISSTFVSPMLFLSIVQWMTTESNLVDLHFVLDSTTLIFRCKSDNDKSQDEDSLSLIKQRLDLQYPDKYTLTLSREVIELKIDVSE